MYITDQAEERRSWRTLLHSIGPRAERRFPGGIQRSRDHYSVQRRAHGLYIRGRSQPSSMAALEYRKNKYLSDYSTWVLINYYLRSDGTVSLRSIEFHSTRLHSWAGEHQPRFGHNLFFFFFFFFFWRSVMFP
jgi:hypothetical protein